MVLKLEKIHHDLWRWKIQRSRSKSLMDQQVEPVSRRPCLGRDGHLCRVVMVGIPQGSLNSRLI